MFRSLSGSPAPARSNGQMRLLLPRTLVLALLALAVVAASAGATTSSIDEYVEHVPAGGKDRPSGKVKRGDPKDLPRAARQELSERGEVGQRTLELAAGGIPGDKDGRGSGKGSGTEDGGSGSAGAGGSGSGGSEVLEAAGDSGSGVGNAIGEIIGVRPGGLGVVLPASLGLTALGAGLLLLARRRGLGS